MKVSRQAVFWGALAGFVCFVLFSAATAPYGPSRNAVRRVRDAPMVEVAGVPQQVQPEESLEVPQYEFEEGATSEEEQDEGDEGEMLEQLVTARDLCRMMAIAYEIQTMNDLAKLPLSEQPEWASKRCGELLELPLLAVQTVLPANFDATECARIKEKYQVVKARNWGGLPVTLQKVWVSSDCDTILKDIAEHSIQAEERQGAMQAQTIELQFEQQSVDETTEAEIAGQQDMKCKELMTLYKVKPGKSWGHLYSPELKNYWKSLDCNKWYWDRVAANTTPVSCPASNRNARALIAIMAGSTSRGVNHPSTANLALFRHLLPSVAKTLDCGFRYVFVLGYDIGDSFYDNPTHFNEAKEWFQQHVQSPLDRLNIVIDFIPVRIKNVVQKPGPVFLEIAKKAYHEGADYFYRVNDDTQLIDRWPQLFVEALKSLGAPYGVVGPTCFEDNPKILTHDFTHRSHMEIFQLNYYPPELVDWWMDDWISRVYGSQRTFKLKSVEAVHHTSTHGQRYAVNSQNKKSLDTLVSAGRSMIQKYMATKRLDAKVLRSFAADKRAGPPYKDFRVPR